MDETAYETDEPRRPREDFRDGTTPPAVGFRPTRDECERRSRFAAADEGTVDPLTFADYAGALWFVPLAFSPIVSWSAAAFWLWLFDR